MINTFVFTGRPGSGKGTQSELLARKLGCKVFSSGKRLREMAKEASALGRKVGEILDSGNLVPAWLSSFLFEEVILSLKSGETIIIDGAGRREPEARLFAEVCGWLGRDFLVINLNVSEKTVVERLNRRRAIEGRADDSNIQNRFDSYNLYTVPALDFFYSMGKVVDVDGEPLQDAVFTEVWGKLGIYDKD